MKNLILLISAVLLLHTTAFTQTIWTYDFGTASGSFNTASSISTFLPDPPAGTDQVRVGFAGGGFELLNPLGTDSELKITASTSTGDGGINKFSVIDYPSSKIFSVKFTIKLDFVESTRGYIYFFIGDGNYFSDDVRYNGSNVFAGIRWRKFESESFASTALLNYVLPDEWFDINNNVNANTETVIELFGNNSTTTQYYNYNSTSVELLPSYYSFYINGVLIGNYLKGISPILADDQNIDSFMFLAEGSPSNLYSITVDDIYYSNELIAGPLPVELSSFTAKSIGNTVNLNWSTKTEVNNYGFEIERSALSAERQTWEKIGFVNGNGNCNSPKKYSFIDKNTVGGNKYQYRLKQIDNDGRYEYSKIVEVNLGAPKKFELSQNYPNPFNPTTIISYNIPEATNVKLTIFNLLGQEIKTLVNEFKEAGVHTVNFNASELNSGLYIYKLQAGTFTQTRKMTLVK